MRKIKWLIILLVIIGLAAACFFYFHYKVYEAKGANSNPKKITIEKGKRLMEIGEQLEKEKIISGKYYFAYYVWKSGAKGKIAAGEYEIPDQLTIPEIVVLITAIEKESNQVKITIPEGWMNKDIESRLKNSNLDVTDFSKLTTQPKLFQDKYGYNFLAEIPAGKKLEGYLFPDTYFFAKNSTSEEMIKKMLDNFNTKLTSTFRTAISAQGKSIYEVVTMASILEGEVKSEEDRKIVSGIFWNRIKNGQALQSCATLAYVLGENKKQYSFADTRTESPYNTYLNKDLPPGPINNPGIVSINAAINPTSTNYNYFLSDPETGKTVFSKTIEEHNANKIKYGL
jgi:UPF0755 protein